MNTWGGFVQYNIKGSSPTFPSDNDQPHQPELLNQSSPEDGKHDDGDADRLATYLVLPAAEIKSGPPSTLHAVMTDACATTIPENTPLVTPHPGQRHSPGGSTDDLAGYNPDQSGRFEGAQLQQLTVQDILEFGLSESPGETASELDAYQPKQEGEFLEIPDVKGTTVSPAPRVWARGFQGDSEESFSLPSTLNPALPEEPVSRSSVRSSVSAATSPECERPPVRSSGRTQTRRSTTKRHRSTSQELQCTSSASASSPPRKHRSLSLRGADAETDESFDEMGTSNSDGSTVDLPMDTDDHSSEQTFGAQYPGQMNGLELCIVRQPEANHRARYQTEGSRGCIKDRTGLSCPTVQLKGLVGNEKVVLHVYAATEIGAVEPHHMYRVSKAGGKKATPSQEVVSEGTHMLELKMHRSDNWIAKVDCLGITKCRNTDITPPDAPKNGSPKVKMAKRSRKLRLVFQTTITSPDGRSVVLRAVSTPLSCTPLPGLPEIHHLSHREADAAGGQLLVVIGRNFVKDESKFYIIEKSDGNNDKIAWEREIPLHPEHFQTVHIVGLVPAYHNPIITQPVHVFIVVRNKGKQSEPFGFSYVPSPGLMPPVAEIANLHLDSEAVPQAEKLSFLLDPNTNVNFPMSAASYSSAPTNNSNRIQLMVRADQNNPTGHVITITVPGSNEPHAVITAPTFSTSASPALDYIHETAQTDSLPSKLHQISQQQPSQSADMTQQSTDMTQKSTDMTQKSTDMTQQSQYNTNASSDYDVGDSIASQQRFNELLRDILGSEPDHDQLGTSSGPAPDQLGTSSGTAPDQLRTSSGPSQDQLRTSS
ncbi:Nuclear factor of activated T-cells 5 [Hypsibius exemplaris]|uniref:Nuclear factor of activated T-cells 5 n=1 Tax=Hypsibius exemplaris TaxID=2072580 RepID=A0A9X6NGH2_HYPEX|nr:Nuclear factor of activated T-cells 5 [Hypsibius exemplaris]